MSRYAGDPAYYFSEQYRKAKEYKARAREEYRQIAREKAKQMPKKKILDAVDNARKGIWSPRQLDNQTKYFVTSKVNNKLLQKLGAPALTGDPTMINP
jgi:hypothetical protein